MSDFDEIDRPRTPLRLVEVADLLREQAGAAPPLAEDPIVSRLSITVGQLMNDFIYQLDNGEYSQLRARMEEVARWLKDLALPAARVLGEETHG